MSAADGPQSTRQHFQHSPAPRGPGRCQDAKQAPCQRHSTVPAGGGGAAPGSPPTFATDPAHPLTPPHYPQAGYRETEAQRLGALLLSMTGGSTEKTHNSSCGSLTLPPSSCQTIWVPELREGSWRPDGSWKSHQTRLGMVPMPKTQPSWRIR